jgi:adenylyltransferase/sulfurtransferase
MASETERAIQIKELIENGSIHNIVTNAQRAFPNECCGFVLESGAVIPAQNIIETLQDKSLTGRNAFLIDGESWKIASTNASPIICIYHSHTNGDPNMSETDRHMLRWQGLFYLIIGLVDTNPTAAKIFWWNDEELSELNIKL